MRVPTVHTNGTSKGDLMRYHQRVIDPLRDAISMLRLSGPNGRDFYTQGNKAMQEAADEHSARIEKLSEVLVELESLMEQIDAQN